MIIKMETFYVLDQYTICDDSLFLSPLDPNWNCLCHFYHWEENHHHFYIVLDFAFTSIFGHVSAVSFFGSITSFLHLYSCSLTWLYLFHSSLKLVILAHLFPSINVVLVTAVFLVGVINKNKGDPFDLVNQNSVSPIIGIVLIQPSRKIKFSSG